MPIIDCPKCRKGLQLPDEYAGQLVQCPHCQQTFNAGEAPGAEALSTAPLKAPPPTPKATWTEVDEPEERPRRRRRRDYEDDYDDYYDDIRRPRRYETPHRGAMILTFGILSVAICLLGPILGPMAWVMGTNDLREMDAGRMDRSGEGITRAGQIIGIIGTILSIAVLFFYFCLGAATLGFRH
jgi:hypothetical protein